jgi:cholest-4-en-3-one 26-monooxygenase
MQQVDLLDPSAYLNDVPHDRFELLRREAPVYWHDEPSGPGFWAITKHADVLAVLRDAATFSSEAGGTQIPDLPKEDMRRSPDVLAIMDPPRHSRYRALIGQSFTSHGLSGTERYIEKRVNGLINEVLERRQFDFIADFSARLPMAVILNMVGVPERDEAQINNWVLKLLATDDPQYQTSAEERARIAGEFMGYAHAIAAERRKAPRNDLLSLLMAAEVDGVTLSYQEFAMFFMLLLAAGTDTPRLVLGSGMLALMERPDLRTRITENPRLLTSTVEELLRYYPPLMHFRRTAVRDTSINGQKIKAGQKVVAWLVSANRDEDVFVAPHNFKIDRTPNEHLAFGYGPHFCIGNMLARMTVQIGLHECVRRMPGLELDGPVERLRSNWFNGPKAMPVATGSKIVAQPEA